MNIILGPDAGGKQEKKIGNETVENDEEGEGKRFPLVTSRKKKTAKNAKRKGKGQGVKVRESGVVS